MSVMFHILRPYCYYPGADVYYRPADRMWFYLEGSTWRFSGSLPSSMHIDAERSVSLTMATDEPFRFHQAVSRDFPADYFAPRTRVDAAPARLRLAKKPSILSIFRTAWWVR